MEKIKKLSKAIVCALFVSVISLVFIFSGVYVLLETGIPEKLVLRCFGLLLIICGLGCASCLVPEIEKIMANDKEEGKTRCCQDQN